MGRDGMGWASNTWVGKIDFAVVSSASWMHIRATACDEDCEWSDHNQLIKRNVCTQQLQVTNTSMLINTDAQRNQPSSLVHA